MELSVAHHHLLNFLGKVCSWHHARFCSFSSASSTVLFWAHTAISSINVCLRCWLWLVSPDCTKGLTALRKITLVVCGIRSIDALQFTNVRHIPKKPKCSAGELSCSGALAQQRNKGESGNFILSSLEWNATGHFLLMLTPSCIPHSSLCSQPSFA